MKPGSKALTGQQSDEVKPAGAKECTDLRRCDIRVPFDLLSAVEVHAHLGRRVSAFGLPELSVGRLAAAHPWFAVFDRLGQSHGPLLRRRHDRPTPPAPSRALREGERPCSVVAGQWLRSSEISSPLRLPEYPRKPNSLARLRSSGTDMSS